MRKDSPLTETLNVLRIIDGTAVDGPKFRTSIYLAGCNHHCEGCHNPQSWDKEAGTKMTVAEIMDRVKGNDMPVTLTGGDPMMFPQKLLPLLRCLHDECIDTWVYTGYTFEEIMSDTQRRPLLELIDVLVDGRFQIADRDTSLLFRGSSNQRLIDLKRTLSSPSLRPILWESDF